MMMFERVVVRRVSHTPFATHLSQVLSVFFRGLPDSDIGGGRRALGVLTVLCTFFLSLFTPLTLYRSQLNGHNAVSSHGIAAHVSN